MSSCETPGTSMEEAARHLAEALSKDDISTIPDEALQDVLAQAVRVFAAKRQAREDKIEIFPTSVDVTATEVSITALCMLKAVQLQVFELGLWQNWAGEI